MLSEEFKQEFLKGYDCGQVVVRQFAEELGITEDEANRMAACFGGGMQMGSVCGAYLGAMIVIGMKYGHSKPENLNEQKGIMSEKNAEFRQRFLERFGAVECTKIIGCDLTTSEGIQKALDEDKLFGFCPKLAEQVVEMLKTI